MFGKLVLVILVLGGVAATLLVDRQQRLDLAAEMTRTHARLRKHEQALWQLRAEIAYRTKPAQIRAAVERLGVRMVPIPDRLERSRVAPPPRLASSSAEAAAGVPAALAATPEELQSAPVVGAGPGEGRGALASEPWRYGG